jgi:hypothetical protein
MRIVISVLLLVHGLIHIFGFLKAFGIVPFEAISQPVSRTYGVVWLLAFLLFVLTLLLYLTHNDYWWVAAFAGVLVSQFLIILYWKDAKYGSLINLVVVIWAIVGYYSLNFRQMVKSERMSMLSLSQGAAPASVTQQTIAHLPVVVKNWLLASGVEGKQVTNNVYIEQKALMVLKPEQTDWHKASADQLFTLNPPSFNWSVQMAMGPGIKIAGRDRFYAGRGEMLIKLMSAIPVVRASNSPKIDQATLQRYLAEIVWFPWAALSPYINWTAIDANSALATMEFEGVKASGTFYFDQHGQFEKFTAMRYKDAADNDPSLWIVTANRTEVLNGIRVPVELTARWQLEDVDWTWLKLKITAIHYDRPSIRAAID